MKIAMLTPLPPTRSGVAHYSSLLLPALAERVSVQAFDTFDEYDAAAFDLHVYQLGNNPHHERMYVEAMETPGVAVLHDLVLHHLIVEMTLARGDVDGYVNALEANHGPAGAAWARGRSVGLHSEMGNFLMPASVEVARRSRAVIVHNEYARKRLQSFGVATPIHVVPHPWMDDEVRVDGAALRSRLGIGQEQRVIGFFGFLTSAKRAEVALEAFRIARRKDSRLTLLIVGEPAPNIDPAMLSGEGIVTTGYVADEDFPLYYAVADRLVNLRYPSAGETSGTLIRAFDAGKPVAVSDYAQFAEFPDDCVFKVPLGGSEVDRLVEFFTSDLPDVSAAQRHWLQSNSRLDQTVDGYLAALRDAAQPGDTHGRGRAVTNSIPLFPRVRLDSTRIADQLVINVSNRGNETIRTHTYGQPEYRVIAKFFEGERVVDDRWLALPCDLAPGATTEIRVPLHVNATTLRLYHALQDVPMLEPEAWAELQLAEVRRVQ